MKEYKYVGAFSKTLIAGGSSFFASAFALALYSNIAGIASLHTKVLGYISYFLESLNFLELGYALGLSTILVAYSLISIMLYYVFDLGKHHVRSESFFNMEQYMFTVLISLGYAGLAVAITAPYLEEIRYTYNHYNLLLGIEIMGASLIGLVFMNMQHYLGNSLYSPLPQFFEKMMQQIKKEKAASSISFSSKRNKGKFQEVHGAEGYGNDLSSLRQELEEYDRNVSYAHS